MSKSPHDTKNAEEPKEYPLVWVRGLALPEPLLDQALLEEVMDFKPCDSDIFIVTYPKCGTTWMQFLVWEIMHKGAPPPSPNQMMFQYIPFIEYTGVPSIEKLNHPRVMKSHLPFHLNPYNPLSKYIYIVRNPWDCCVSYFHHNALDTSLPTLSFEDYFNCFLKGEVGWGDYFDHVLSWSKHRDDPNVLFLTYEGLKKDPKAGLLKVAKFLGDSYYEDLQNEEILENCLKHSDFKYMKQLGMFFPKHEKPDETAEEEKQWIKLMGEVERDSASEMKFVEVPFFRKGVIGDWKNHFTPEHVERFNEYMTRKLKNTDMEDFWPSLIGETAL